MDWDQSYQNNETPWERGEPAPPLVEYLESHSISGRVLVPGCGLGHDVRLVASMGCDTLGVDLSETALNRARAYKGPEQGSVSYQLADMLDANNGIRGASFDYVFEHTCFCAIDPGLRKDYVNAVQRHLKPRGYFLAILFTNLDDPEGPPFPTSHAEVENLYSPVFEIVRHWKPTRYYAGREDEESMYLMRKLG
ncbi:TPMT family class I SAM-dependent methyltransferase [Opitutaceae bacterium]|nr:TPMT family class I SAM-dependent methyltransferase [Opitutaceae bacterium]